MLRELGERRTGGGGVFAIVAECLLGDVGDAGELTFGGVEIAEALGVQDLGAEEVEQVDDRLKRVIDLVRNGGGHPAGRGDLFGLDERGFDALLAGDVAKNL